MTLSINDTYHVSDTGVIPVSSTPAYRSYANARKQLYEYTKRKQPSLSIYKEILRSLLAKFGSFSYFNGDGQLVDIKCIHASPERAVAKLKQHTNIILPIISVAHMNTNNDDDRQKYEPLLVHEKYWDENKQRAIRLLSLAPRPVNLMYNISIWTLYKEDMDQISEQIRLEFNPEMIISNPFSANTKAFIETEEDIGTTNVGDKEPRVLQRTIELVVRTYINNPKFLYTATGEIEEFKFDIDLIKN